MFDYFRLSTLLTRTLALYFILLLLPRSALGDTWYGDGVFRNIVIMEYKWHVDSDNIIVDVANTRGWQHMDPYPCREAWNNIGKALGGRFQSCTLYRDLAGEVDLGTYTKLDQLTKSQLQAFVNRTGVLGPVTSYGRRAQFVLSVQSSNGSTSGDFLPTQASSGGGGIPPTEVEPPLSCSISDSTINHGVIDSKITNAHVGRSNVSVWCTKRATVRIKANSYNSANGIVLNGPGELKSFVTLNGIAASTGVTVDANNSSSISVESTLRGTGDIAAGSYSGSITLVASII
ncbi:hypothetical protein AB4K01_18975 [Serratia fonticola]|uniref:MrpH family fimbial adhesin n=1 Tax=Serratia fonticola TaxID=47917 RepID=UPI0034C6640B